MCMLWSTCHYLGLLKIKFSEVWSPRKMRMSGGDFSLEFTIWGQARVAKSI